MSVGQLSGISHAYATGFRPKFGVPNSRFSDAFT